MSVLSEGESSVEPLSAPAIGSHPDAVALADALRLHGPLTDGAAASRLGWGATRAWQAEARLRAAGLVRFDHLGQAKLADAK